jgi:glucose-1-phosphate adenylyltransferase
MARMRTLAVVLAGGAGSRMDVLTRERAKPALPFAGSYRLIDFPLSNLHHSGIDDVWLSVQYQAASLDEGVANGRPWDLDRTRGGFRLLLPQQGVGGAAARRDPGVRP